MPNQTELAEQGNKLLRSATRINAWGYENREAILALCDYAEKTIAGRRKGGSKPKGDISRANGRKHTGKRRE